MPWELPARVRGQGSGSSLAAHLLHDLGQVTCPLWFAGCCSAKAEVLVYVSRNPDLQTSGRPATTLWAIFTGTVGRHTLTLESEPGSCKGAPRSCSPHPPASEAGRAPSPASSSPSSSTCKTHRGVGFAGPHSLSPHPPPPEHQTIISCSHAPLCLGHIVIFILSPLERHRMEMGRKGGWWWG